MQLKTVLIIPLCVMILGSVVTPSLTLLNDLKMEIADLEDFSEEESSVFEHECSEKEMVLNSGNKHDFILSMLKRASLDSQQYFLAGHSVDILLPPPEILSWEAHSSYNL